MRAVAIIGAGQAGLQLAIGLKKLGYEVSLYSNRTAEAIKNGFILSSPCMFDAALQTEKSLGLNFWDTACPANKTVSCAFGESNRSEPAISWKGVTSHVFQAVDHRVKFSYWMDEFEKLGGNLYIQEIQIKDLENIAKKHELTLLAGGKSEITGLFPIDSTRTSFDKPQRKLVCLYVKGALSSPGLPGVRVNIIPGVGEFFIASGLSLNGPCGMMLFEGIPGGPFDDWGSLQDPEHQLERALALLKQFVPWEYEYWAHSELSDPKAILQGGYTPLVKLPTLRLPCNIPVLGMGDAVVLNDPIGGQGANNAAKNAALYLKCIQERGNATFTEQWMKETFELYWNQIAQWSTKWTELLLSPAPAHMVELMQSASECPSIANFLADAFGDPSTLFPWITDPQAVIRFIINKKKNQNVIYTDVVNLAVENMRV